MRNLTFDNCFTRNLPGDKNTSEGPRQVLEACYSLVHPTPVSDPELVAYSSEMARTLELPDATCNGDEFLQVFSGNKVLPQMEPFAMCYGGHQFGNWAGQLGDGRAINLGEVVTTEKQRWMLQLKGAGPTPYSRTADGLAVLRSSVREFLCSEAMFHLGVPTTRALCLLKTGEHVLRDMFYNGNAKMESGAVVCRVAPSFTRFGNFQIFAARGSTDILKQLVDHTIQIDFPHLGEPSEDVYLMWFQEIVQRTAEMIVHWMRVGFVHGVMNTDNLSILGLTIDYGPYGWLENFDPNWTPNTTDAAGRRYRFGHQPQIAFWNLGQLANALSPLFPDTEKLQTTLQSYSAIFEQGWQDMIAQKLGFQKFIPESDAALSTELLTIMQMVETDMTIFHRNLANVSMTQDADNASDEALMEPLMPSYYRVEELTTVIKERTGRWLRDYIRRIQKDGTLDATRKQQMDAVNPVYVLRNYLAQLAIDKADANDYSMVQELLGVLRRPYEEQPGKESFAEKRPEWARHKPGCSMLSCSS